jgi:ureidoglycolate lyase
MRTVQPEPLTATAFAPYGDVIEPAGAADAISINYGNTTRFHDLFPVEVSEGDGDVCVNIFRSNPLPDPIKIEIMENHPLGSQAFIPLSQEPYLVVVAPAGEFDANTIRVFRAASGQGVNYSKGTWHHFCLALNTQSDFLVIDRKGEGDNCVEVELDEADQLTISL